MRCFDGHCDTLARCMTTGEGLRQNGGHVDLARCAALGQHAQIFAVFADSSKTSAPLYTVAQRQHALLERECARNADLVRRCRTARDVRAAWAAGKTAALLGIEGAELLDCDLDGCNTLGGGITGVQDYPKLYAAIKACGYDAALLQDLFADNWLRVLPK